MNKKYILLGILTSTLSFFNLQADLNTDPSALNVYTIGNIGSSTNPYSGSDFQGMAGSGGSDYLQNFSLNANGSASSATPYSLYSGGTVSYTGATNNGGIQAAGTVTTNNSTINGNVSSGGNLAGSYGTITGNVSVTGTNQSTATINGTMTTGVSYTPFLNQTTVSNYFKNASSFWANSTASTTYTTSYGTLTSTLTTGRNIINITLSNFNSLTGITLSGSANSYLIFNITNSGAISSLAAPTYNFSGGLNMNNVLINLPNATSISMTGGTFASLLAPKADVTFTNGVLQGNLVVNNLYGSGQVNSGSFIGYNADKGSFVATPEPATYAMLASMMLLTALFSTKRVQIRVRNLS